MSANDRGSGGGPDEARPQGAQAARESPASTGVNEGVETSDSGPLVTLDLSTAREVIYSSKSEIRNPVKLFSDIYADFVAGRELSWRLFVRNLRGMYRQTLFGLFWAFLPPIANTAIWVFLRKQGSFDDASGSMHVDPTAFILTGMILWQAFIDAFQAPINLLNSNRNMVSKLRFPRESLLLVGFGEVVFNLLIRMLLLVPVFWWFQVELHASLVLVPFVVLALVWLGMAFGMLLMPVGSLYQDVGRFITLFIPFWMILTPIIYAPSHEPGWDLLNWVNPAAPLLILARDLILNGHSDFAAMGIGFAIAAIPLVLIGLVVYRVSLPVLIERMSA